MKQSKIVFAATLGLMLTSAMPAQSADKVYNYVRDSEGNVVRDGSGDCVRSYDKTTVLLEECGYKPKKEAKPAPAPLPAPKKGDVLERIVVNNIQFKFDSAELTDDAKATLDALASRLGAHKSSLAAGNSTMSVTGYTDTSGPEAYNQALSERRASAVAKYLSASHGISLSEMNVSGKGEADPIADNSTREGRMRNRRVEIEIVQN
jgi:OOP family OmpA-OmpF porin